MSTKITNHQFAVTPGDTLSGIISTYNRANGTNYSVDQIARFNNISNPGKIRVGALINFPIDANSATKGSGIWKGSSTGTSSDPLKGPNKIEWSYPLSDLGFEPLEEDKDKWLSSEVTLRACTNNDCFRKTIRWFYWRTPSSGGGYKLYWSLEEKSKKPDPHDPFMTYQDRSDLAGVHLTIQGDWQHPKIKLERK